MEHSFEQVIIYGFGIVKTSQEWVAATVMVPKLKLQNSDKIWLQAYKSRNGSNAFKYVSNLDSESTDVSGRRYFAKIYFVSG